MTGLFLIFMSLRLLCIHPAFINKAFNRIHRKLTGQQWGSLLNLRGDEHVVGDGKSLYAVRDGGVEVGDLRMLGPTPKPVLTDSQAIDTRISA
jgi:hypothetical protein